MQSLKKHLPKSGKVHQLHIENAALRAKLENGNVDLSEFVFGQVQPQAVELEETILGACLLEQGAFKIVNEILNENDFYVEKNQIIFSCFRQMTEKPIAIDLVTASQFVRDNGHADQIGGVYHLMELMNRVGSAANIEHHARIVYQKSHARKMINFCTEAIRNAYDGSSDIFDLYDVLNERTRLSNPKAILRSMSMDEALKEGKAEPIRKQLIGSLLREGDMCLMFGDEGTGKSVGAVQIGLAVANGLPLFGDDVNFKNECAPKKTLLFDFELETPELFQRYNEVGNAYKFGDNFRRVDMNPENFEGGDENAVLRTVQNIIEKERPEFVIIDNLTWLTSEAQDTAVAATFMKMFLRLRKKLGFTIIVIAHTPKRNTSEPLESKHMAGSSKLKDFAKNVIGISPSKLGDGIIYVKHLKMRNGEKVFTNQNVIQACIEKCDGLLQWRFMGLTDESLHLATPTIEMSEDEICQRAMKLRDEKQMTWEEILTEMSLPFTRTTLFRKVQKYEMLNAEKLKNAKDFDSVLKK